MKKHNVAAAILFCGFLIAMAAGYLLPKKTFSEMEKRYLAEAPAFHAKAVFSGQWGRQVEEYHTNCWLSGEDYNVHVDYWIGFVGYTIGIHDADWRTKFGGTNYVRNGSHGCVNTPKEAVIPIFENIEVGVPVLVYGK